MCVLRGKAGVTEARSALREADIYTSNRHCVDETACAAAAAGRRGIDVAVVVVFAASCRPVLLQSIQPARQHSTYLTTCFSLIIIYIHSWGV